MSLCDELAESVPAYVIGALDASERARLEKHLRDCPELRDQLASYAHVIDLLPYAAPPAEPRGNLKYRVLAALAPEPRFSVPNLLTGWLRSPALAALTFVIAIGLVIWNLALQNQLIQQAAANQQAFAELSQQRNFISMVAYTDSPPKKVWATQTGSHVAGRLYIEPTEATVSVFMTEMPPLPPGKVYQVWLIDPNGVRTSGGVFTVDDKGRGWLFIRAPQALNQYRSIGITTEPAPGSPQPTGIRVAEGFF